MDKTRRLYSHALSSLTKDAVPLSAVPVAMMLIRIEVKAANAATLPACTQSTSNTPLTSVAHNASNACAAVLIARSSEVLTNVIVNMMRPFIKKATLCRWPVGVVIELF
jgi:hypothetical protein